jgi:hypothetical protein
MQYDILLDKEPYITSLTIKHNWQERSCDKTWT